MQHQRIESYFEQFVPASGNCATFAGEMVRAVSKLRYDFYNNGMGNNTSGAVNFLFAKDLISRELYDEIYPWTRGKIVYSCEGPLQVAIEKMTDTVCDNLDMNLVHFNVPNSEDMFDYEDPEQEFCFSCRELLDDDEEYGECYSCRHADHDEEWD